MKDLLIRECTIEDIRKMLVNASYKMCRYIIAEDLYTKNAHLYAVPDTDIMSGGGKILLAKVFKDGRTIYESHMGNEYDYLSQEEMAQAIYKYIKDNYE